MIKIGYLELAAVVLALALFYKEYDLAIVTVVMGFIVADS